MPRAGTGKRGFAVPFVFYRILVIALTALAVLAPLSLVFYQSFLTGPFFQPSAKLSLDAYRFVFADGDFWSAFGTTLLIAAGMAVIAVPLGAMLAFLMVRTDVPGRSWLEPFVLVPIFVSAVVIAFGYVVAMGPVGFFSIWVKSLIGFTPWNLYSLFTLIIIAGLTHVPHVYLYTAAALRGLGSDLEEAARVVGANPWKVAIDVSLPMVLPAILFAGVLVFFLGFELFGLPLVLGDPQGILVLSTYLFKLTNKLGVPSYQLMAVVVVVIVAVTAPLVFLQRMLLGQSQRYVSMRGKGLRVAPLKLARWRWPAFAAIVCWFAFTVIVPLAGITLRSFVSGWGEGVNLSEVLTLDHYRELLDYPNVIRGMINTFAIGVIGGAMAVACYTAIALAIHRWPSRWTYVVDYLVMVPRAMPGLIAGLAMLWVFLFVRPLNAAQVDADIGLARLHHRVARLRHAACLGHAAAGRPRARRIRPHNRRQPDARDARRHRTADQIRHAGELAAHLSHLRARIFDRHLSPWPRHRGDRLAAGLAVGHGRGRSGLRVVGRECRHDRGGTPHRGASRSTSAWLNSSSAISACVSATTRSSRASPSPCRRAKSSRCSGLPAVARPRCCAPSPASKRRIPARFASATPCFSTRAKKIDLPAEQRGLGLVFQSYALWPHRTVFDNVAYGLKLRGVGADEMKARVERALAQIGLAHLAARYPHQLSGGQQQRVALARALVYEPAVILLDEPLSNLDAKLREEARAWLRQLIVTLNLSALCVTHDQIEAMAIADSITLLNAGLIEQEGTPTELYTEPKSLFAAEFMGSNNRLEGVLVEILRQPCGDRCRQAMARGHGAQRWRDGRQGDGCDPYRARAYRGRPRRQPHPDAAHGADVSGRTLGGRVLA